jgi:opacity protein-like surface antigen
MKNFIFAAIAVIVGVMPAGASDLGGSTKDEPTTFPAIYRTAAHFGGGYIGASVNWERLDVDQRGSLDWSQCDNCEHNDAGQVWSGKLPGMSDDAFAGGVQAGYNFELGRVYVGPVVKFDLGGPSASLKHSFDENGDVTGELNFDVNWSATVAAKFGVAVTDRIGVYGFAGVGFVDVDVNGNVHANLGAPIGGIGLNSKAHNDTVTAFTYGVGGDLKITDRWRAFAEWQRFDLDTFNASGSVLLDCVTYGYKGNAELDVIRVGVNVAF